MSEIVKLLFQIPFKEETRDHFPDFNPLIDRLSKWHIYLVDRDLRTRPEVNSVLYHLEQVHHRCSTALKDDQIQLMV